MDEKRFIGFLCPYCKQSVIVEISKDQLLTQTNRLPCPCGKSGVELKPMEDYLQIMVPCAFCGDEHTAKVPLSALYREKTLALSCQKTGMNSCIIGEEGPVTAAMQRVEKSYYSMQDRLERQREMEAEEDGSAVEKSNFLNDFVMQEVLSEIREIAKRDGISCSCGSKQWKIKVHYGSVDIICAKCGAVLRLPAATSEDIDDVCCKTYLLIRGKENGKS